MMTEVIVFALISIWQKFNNKNMPAIYGAVHWFLMNENGWKFNLNYEKNDIFFNKKGGVVSKKCLLTTRNQ